MACEQRNGCDLNVIICGPYFALGRKVGGHSRSGLEMACAGKGQQHFKKSLLDVTMMIVNIMHARGVMQSTARLCTKSLESCYINDL